MATPDDKCPVIMFGGKPCRREIYDLGEKLYICHSQIEDIDQKLFEEEIKKIISDGTADFSDFVGLFSPADNSSSEAVEVLTNVTQDRSNFRSNENQEKTILALSPRNH